MAALAALAGVTLAGCGTSVEHVGIGASTTANSSTTSRPATCRVADLAVDQVPLSSGTSISSSAWSLTNTSREDCELPVGPPTLAFVDAAGQQVAHYTTTPLRSASRGSGYDTAVELSPGDKAWFLTEESTTTCGVGATIAGGPFRYEVGLPGGAGRVPWAPSYLSAATLSDFCADVSLAIGGLQPTEPSATP